MWRWLGTHISTEVKMEMALRHKPGIQKEIKAWIVAFTLSTILTIGLLAIKEMFMK